MYIIYIYIFLLLEGRTEMVLHPELLLALIFIYLENRNGLTGGFQTVKKTALLQRLLFKYNDITLRDLVVIAFSSLIWRWFWRSQTSTSSCFCLCPCPSCPSGVVHGLRAQPQAQLHCVWPGHGKWVLLPSVQRKHLWPQRRARPQQEHRHH